MKYNYKRVDISNLQGIKRAGQLQSNPDWKIISSGVNTVLFERVEKIKKGSFLNRTFVKPV